MKTWSGTRERGGGGNSSNSGWGLKNAWRRKWKRSFDLSCRKVRRPTSVGWLCLKTRTLGITRVKWKQSAARNRVDCFSKQIRNPSVTNYRSQSQSQSQRQTIFCRVCANLSRSKQPRYKTFFLFFGKTRVWRIFWSSIMPFSSIKYRKTKFAIRSATGNFRNLNFP